MIFNEASFFLLFLAPCGVAFHLVPRHWRGWTVALFGIAFFVYYAYLHFGGWSGSACVLLFALELATSRLYRPGSRWCIFGVVQAVAILAVFKYLRFLAGLWNDVGLPAIRDIPQLALPLGVSFFTFEFIHFAVDSYRGRIDGARIDTYAAFIFFFPTMVAGPIKRFQDFGPYLEQSKLNADMLTRATTRILAGLAKKHVLADTFSLWSDQLQQPQALTASRWAVCGWIFAYGAKIYLDFSGYSDIAIGCGQLFGMKIPENFDWPYASVNIAEFWRRWHISLGRWIFDYVYVGLGGSRQGLPRTLCNLVATMAISGLWHGAAYNFVAWGLWHGVLMALHRLWRDLCVPRGWSMPAGVAWALTFTSVMFGWSLFCMDIHQWRLVMSHLGGWR